MGTPPNLFLKRFDSTGDDPALFYSRLQCFPQSVSPDGKTLLYVTVDPTSGNDLWLLDLSAPRGADGFSRRPLLATKFGESYARISPDGRWLAYTSNDSGRSSVYVAPLAAPASKKIVATDGARVPVWSKDGHELFFVDGEGVLSAALIKFGEPVGAPVKLFNATVPLNNLGAVTPYDVTSDGRFLVNRIVDHTIPSATVIANWSPAPIQKQ